MLSFTQGNLLTANTEALVNTVNTVGIMGKGIALMFKEKFPENYKIYEAACKRGEVSIGRMLVTERQDMYGPPKWIINFPTKQHWRSPSQIEWIEEGLDDLVQVIPPALQAILVQGPFDLGTVKREQVDDLGKVRGKPDQPEHVPDLASG